MTRKRRVRRVRRGGGPAHIPTEEELQEEYAYVIKDLRRVGILALVMFAVLIIANLLI